MKFSCVLKLMKTKEKIKFFKNKEKSEIEKEDITKQIKKLEEDMYNIKMLLA